MGEAFGYPELAFVFGGESYPCPAAEGRRVAAQVHSDIEHFAMGDANQLALRPLYLVVQAPQDAAL
ncbi:hypothetical protein D9M71_714820 [compost metagenome]